MNIKKQCVIGLTAVGLFLTTLAFVLLPVTVGRAQSDVLGVAPTIRTTPTTLRDQPEFDPAYTTFVIQYQGQSASPELMCALVNWKAAGRIAAIDADSAPGRIFVLGAEMDVLALRDLPGVVAVTQAGGPPLDFDGPGQAASPASTGEVMPISAGPRLGPIPAALLAGVVREENSALLPYETEEIKTFHLALNPALPASERERLVDRLQGLSVSGQAGVLDEQALTLHVTALSTAYDSLNQLPSVMFISAAPEYVPASPRADGHITGVVTADDGGAPLAYAGIAAYQDSPYVYRYASANASGVYSLSVPPGTYRVIFYSPDYHIDEYYDDVPFTMPNASTPVVVGDGEVVPNINASLAPGMLISGRVTDRETSDPLQNIDVYIDGYNDYYYSAYGLTNADGVYTTTPGLPARTYRVFFADYNDVYATEYYSDTFHYSQATPVALTSADLTGIDASLTKAATIVGDVTGPGAVPLGDVNIRVYYADEYWNTDSSATDENGHYFLGGLPPIAHKLWFRDNSGQHLSEWYQDKADWDTADPVTLTSSVTTTIDVELAQAGVIAGVVTAEGSSAPLGDIDVNVYEASSGNYVDDDTTNASGAYRIGGLAPGDYKLYLRDINGVYLAEYYDDKPSLDSADPVSVAAGMTTTVNAQLTPAGFIVGAVTAEDGGALLEGIDVSVYDASTGSYVTGDTTDALGTYFIGGLASGNYKASFYDYGGVYLYEYYDDKPDLASADPFSVTEGVTTTINAQLVQGGVISGVVTAEVGGALLDGISVSVYDATTGYYVDDDNTDVSGVYRIGSLAAGSYKVQFYDYGGVYLYEYYDDKPNFVSADPISVTEGVTTTINAQLVQGGVISGVVTAEGSGAPLGNVDVDVYEASSGDYVADDTTDASGVYRIGGLVAGDYKLRFRDINGIYITEYYDDKPDFASADPVSVTAGMTSTANAQLVQGGVISGVVTAEGSGAPLGNVDVDVYEASSGDYVADDTTDASGVYHIGGLVAGDYKLRFRDINEVYLTEYYDDKPSLDSADLVSVTAGMTSTANAQLALGGVVTGVVTVEGSGTPLSNVDVNIYDASSGNYVADDTTDASGAYRISRLPTGNYKMYFRDLNGVYLSEYYDDKPDLYSADPVSVTAGMTTTVNAQLTPGGVITGTVTAEGSGVPLSNVDVNVYDVSTGDYVNDDGTDALGFYRIGSLVSGSYKIYFYDNNGVYAPEYYDDKPDWDSADPVAVTVGVTTTADAQLSLGGVISGTVTDEDGGAPLQDINVKIYEASTGDYIKQQTTDASGAYYIGGLKTNLYKLYCEDNSGQYLTEWYQDRPNQTMADPIAVSVGVMTTINVALASGARVTGRVTDADSGAGIANMRVEAWRYDASSPYGWDYTDAGGYYTTTALYTGVYQVGFYPPTPYYSEYYDGFRQGYGFDLIAVTAPSMTTGINAALHKGYVISGTVRAGSTPLSGVSVQAYRGDSTSYNSVNTNSSGVYRLGPLDPNQYRVRFKPSSVYALEWYSDSASYAGSTAINLSGNLGNVNADLSAGGNITGRVTGSGGAPLADLWVYVYPVGNGKSLVSVRTDDDGYYATAAVLPTGQYQVSFSAPLGYTAEWYNNQPSQNSATAVSVVAGQTTGNVNAQLAAYAHGTITGTVTAADTGLPLSLWVYAYSASGLGTWSDYADGGNFVLQGLPPDAYRVQFSSPPFPYIFRYYHDRPDWDSADMVTVTAGMTTSLMVEALPVGGGISGTVSGSGGGVPGVYVYVRRMVGAYLTGSTYTGVDGGYYLAGLDAGQYRVEFTPPAPFIREWYDDASDAGTSSHVTVTLGATTPNVDAVLEVGGVITGFITAADTGASLPGAYVNIYSSTGALVRDSIYVGMDGQYQTPGLPAGNYQVYFDEGPWSRYIAEWYDDALPSSVHTTVTVPVSGTVPNVNAALDQGGSISGWTYNAHRGWPMGSVNARVYDADTGSYISYDYSNSGGLYQINGLPSGQYEVSFSKSGFKTQWYSRTLDLALTVTVSAPDDTQDINAYLRYLYDVYMPMVLRNMP
jgi:hypothetical protein